MLWKSPDPRVVPALVQTLRSDDDPYIRLVAALALGQIGDHQAVPALLQALRDSDRHVRKVAAGALARMPDALSSIPWVKRVARALWWYSRWEELENTVNRLAVLEANAATALDPLLLPPTVPVWRRTTRWLGRIGGLG